MSTVKIKSPASVANLVCGFDVLGMALTEPYDEMQMHLLDKREIVIRHTDGYGLSESPDHNVAGVALKKLLEEFTGDYGFELIIHKHIKPGSGLGSSAASAAGAVIAANHLLGNPFAKEDLVRFAMAGEELASGVPHADNIAPCIYGGITLIRSMNPLDIISIHAPDLFVSLVHPQIEVRTSDARQILRKELLLKDAIRQWGNIGGLVAGLLRNDYPLISRSLEDVIIEPVRSMLIPGFHAIKAASMQAGALGGGIAGSGPSIFMLSRTEKTARDIIAEMQKVYTQIGLEHRTYLSRIQKAAIQIIPES